MREADHAAATPRATPRLPPAGTPHLPPAATPRLPPAATPRLPPDPAPRDAPLDVALVRAAPRPVDAAALSALSPEERDRASWFHRPEDAARFATGRTIARRLLGARLGVAPAAVDLVVPQRGWKPRVPGMTLDLSIAHAGGLVVVAVADGAEVGVDVEGGPEAARALDEATWRGATSPAERDAAGPLSWPVSGPPPTATVDAFVRTWTRKEALLKAVRLGLAVPMDALTLRDGSPPSVVATSAGLPSPGDLVVLDVDAPPGLRIAVAAWTRRPVVVRDADTGAVLAAAPIMR